MKLIEETSSSVNPICLDANIESGASEAAERLARFARPALLPWFEMSEQPRRRQPKQRRPVPVPENWVMPPIKDDAWYQSHLLQELPPVPPRDTSF